MLFEANVVRDSALPKVNSTHGKEMEVDQCFPIQINSHMNKKNPQHFCWGFLKLATTYSPGIPVPSALMSLTSLFGMGRGGPHCNSHLKRLMLYTHQ